MPVNVETWMDVLDQYDPVDQLVVTVCEVIDENTRHELSHLRETLPLRREVHDATL